jgi:hypothetical protein
MNGFHRNLVPLLDKNSRSQWSGPFFDTRKLESCFHIQIGIWTMKICEGLIPPSENRIIYLYDYLEPQKVGETDHISQ